ncbi:MAG: hypothetical protein ACRC2B_20830 [Rubrivivax sp.]
MLTRFLIERAGLKSSAGDSAAGTLIQCFGSAANLSMHLQCLKLKTPWRDGTRHLVMSPLKFMQGLAALVPRRCRPI